DGTLPQSGRKRGATVEVSPVAWWGGWPPSAWYYRSLCLSVAPNIGRLVRLIKRRRIDLVYTNTLCIFESAIAAALAGVPRVWHVHEVLRSDTRSPGILPVWL